MVDSPVRHAGLVEHVVVTVVVDRLSTCASTIVRARASVGRTVVIRGTVPRPPRAMPSTFCVVSRGGTIVSVSSASVLVHLAVSAAACARCSSWGARAHRAVVEVLAVVSSVSLGILQVGSSRAVAEGPAWSGELSGCAVRALVAVVSNLAVQAGDTLAALVLTCASVAVGSAAATASSLSRAATSSLPRASSLSWASSRRASSRRASSRVARAASSAPLGGPVYVGEPPPGRSWWSCSAAGASSGSAADGATASAAVVPAPPSGSSGPPLRRRLASVSVSAVMGAGIVVEAEANPVPLVFEVAPSWGVVGPLRVAYSSHVPQSLVLVLGARAVHR